MKLKLNELKELFKLKLIEVYDINWTIALEKEFLWKDWILTNFLKWMKDLSIDEKKEIWPLANDLKVFILEEIEKKKKAIENTKYDNIAKDEKIDVTAEFPSHSRWHKHPISITSNLLEEIFISMWYTIADGPQVEKEEYNFDKLNIPDNHPARDVWDTFWISDDINKDKSIWERLLLRTHTSPVQVREMLKWKLPLKIIVPGRVFRYEQEDARHTCNFYQLEWLVVWEWITFWDLKWTLETAMQKLLWEKTKLRFRPSIFPFTEPSAEIDISCQICGGTWEKNWKNCSMCSGSGWVELLGAWMVHPKVLEYCGIDPEKYSGFAFWMWIDRIASQRFGINSWRMLYQSKLKLNEQF
jgi:phenylalanyl-tRNA synthetase alpha chain